MDCCCLDGCVVSETACAERCECVVNPYATFSENGLCGGSERFEPSKTGTSITLRTESISKGSTIYQTI